MYKRKKHIIRYKFWCFLLIVLTSFGLNAQKIRVIDNKGTIKNANNNRVFRQNTDPNPATPTPTNPNITVEGDIWVDTSLTPNITKIWNGTTWENLSDTGTTGSVFFAGVSGGLEENNSQFFWNNNTPLASSYHLSLGSRSGAIANSRRTKLNVFGATTTTRGFVAKRYSDEVSYRFYDDTDTGMRRPPPPVTDNLSLVTNNTEALRINAIQYVGLGINTPASPLHIRRNLADGVGIIRVEGTEPDINFNDTDGGFNTFTFENNGVPKFAFGRRNTDAFYITRNDGTWHDDTFNILNTNGYLGLGIATPTSPLHIRRNLVDGVGIIRVEGTEPDINFNDTDGGFNTFTFENNGVPKFAFGRRNTDAFYITRNDGTWHDDTFNILNTNGYLGLGIATPTSPLHIRRNLVDGVGIIRVEGTEPDINFNDTDGGFNTFTFENNGVPKVLIGRRNDDALYIARRFGGTWYDDTFSVLNNNGFVGINITTPTSRLHINGSVAKHITTTTADLTLSDEHHTVIVAGNHNITLPAAGDCNGRMYIIKNLHNNSITCSTYKDEANADATTINSNTIIHLQSDGTRWQLIAKTPKNYAPVETKTANYTLTPADNGKVINFNSSTAVTLTVPATLPAGFNISIYQRGTGEVTVAGTRQNRLGRYKTAGQYAGAGLVTIATGVNILTGDLKL